MANPSPSSHSLITIGVPTHLLLFLFFTNFISLSLSYSTSLTPLVSSSIPYTKYCNSIVPKASPNGFHTSKSTFPELNSGYFTGGNRILAQNPNFSNDSLKAFVFRTRSISSTDSDGVLMVEGYLQFRVENSLPVYSNYTLGRSKPGRFRTRTHRFPFQRNRLSFQLNGYWSESSGKLCMVGSGTGYSKQGNSLHLSGVFTLSYPKNSTIFTSWVSGSLESVDSVDSVNYFEPISLFSYSQMNYEYTLVSEVSESGVSEESGVVKDSRLGLEREGDVCSRLYSSSGYELVYENDCFVTKNCSPLGSSGAVLPEMIFFRDVQCSGNGRFRLLIGFSKTSYTYYNQPLVLDRMLVGEGVWDGDKNWLNVVACRVLNNTVSLASASIGDCSIRLSMWFPAIMSITSRSHLLGQLWTNKTNNESGYFDKIGFESPRNRFPLFQGLKYEYTEADRVAKSCPKETAQKSEGKYPGGYSYDMKFDMKVRNNRGRHAWGYAVPLSMGNQFYERGMDTVALESIEMAPEASFSPKGSAQMNESHSRILNVSYSIRLTPDYQVGGAISSPNVSLNLDAPVEISAEGIYNIETGHLCMVGCRNVKSSHNHSTDCEIVINVQFRLLNSKSTEYVKGTIGSTRARLDPLYFENLQLTAISLSRTQVRESVWRMDFEITMVLISNTLICIFVGLQIFYVKKHPDVLPSTSLVMLAILTLGQMIPLVLNFEALFLTNRNRHVMRGGGGWLEVNEVLVRVVTMVSFLLQFRLLQLTWSSRLGDGNQKAFGIAEKKALYVLLPLYLVGAFIAWAIHWSNNSHNVYSVHREHSLWGDLRSYAGLLLDCFLLPQILFNLFWNSKDKALHPAFYVGITSVHLLPHAYDLYRAYRYVPYYDAAYIYASPVADFFSTAWDVIIPCGGLLFAILIFLQQRFGGCCILPPRFRQFAAYEKVPVAIGE